MSRRKHEPTRHKKHCAIVCAVSEPLHMGVFMGGSTPNLKRELHICTVVLKYYGHKKAATRQENMRKKNVIMSRDFADVHADSVTMGDGQMNGPPLKCWTKR